MKKILIIIPYFGIGGTTSSLNAFLENVNPNMLQIDIFALKRTGEYLHRYKNCTVLAENIFLSSQLYNSNFILSAFCWLLHGFHYLLSKLGLSLYPILCRIGGDKLHTMEYDAVISYQESLSGFLSYLPAKKRIAWIRSEYERYIKIAGNKDETKYFKKIDTVVTVSEFAKQSFKKVHSWHPDVVTINNFMNIQDVREDAKDTTFMSREFKKGDFTIVSVGRIAPVKQFERIPELLHEIRNQTGKDVRWYIIGGSRGFENLEQKINEQVVELGLEDCFKVLPETPNPYAYMAEADLFVHTSKSETYSRVVAESKAVGTPVVVNNFAAAYEFVKDGIEGFIVPVEDMAITISRLIEDRLLYAKIKGNLEQYSWPNEQIMVKTIELF